MNYQNIPEKPLVAGVGKVEPNQKTYFYERSDGSVICVQAQEAWKLHKKRFKQVGVSDGTKFRQAIAESQEIFHREGLAAAQARIKKGEQEELEAARGRYEVPPNADKMGNGAHLLTI